MYKHNQLSCFPSSEDLPRSYQGQQGNPYQYLTGYNEIPVDNELQYLIPNLLLGTLAIVWADRWDWFFGIRIGIGYHLEKPPLVSDAFLSLGIERTCDDEGLHFDYWVSQEEPVPLLVLEVVSAETYRGEYGIKAKQYAELGVLYYVVYAPYRRRNPTLSVYRLTDGEYVLQPGNSVWLPEIGLGIGREEGTYQGIAQEWVYWYNEQGQRLLTPEERIQQAEERARRLEEKLRSLGVDPDSLP